VEITGWLDLNRANWDDRAAVHAGSGFYDLDGFRAGASTLRAFEADELGDVTGKRLLHLQCHMGQDTLSWARLGAQVTGLDFSPAAIATARDLAAQIGLADLARFVDADVYSAVHALGGQRFDIVYTGLGALVGLPDLTRWANEVASCLSAGGVFYIVEFHPLAQTLDDDGRTLAHDYFDAGPQMCDCPVTYTDGPPLSHTTRPLGPGAGAHRGSPWLSPFAATLVAGSVDSGREAVTLMKDWFGRDIAAVEDLERMTPAEQQANFEASIVWDLEQLPARVRERIVTRAGQVIAQRDAEQAAEKGQQPHP
jgi:SAM-dependent methyltransferase